MAYQFDISETIREGLEGNVYFRETQAALHPEDWRNRLAVDRSRTLMTSAVSMKWQTQYQDLMTALEAIGENDEFIARSVGEATGEAFRLIGFWSSADSADDIAEQICRKLSAIKTEHEKATGTPEANRPRPRMPRPDTSAHERRVRARPALELRLLAEKKHRP